MIEPTTTAWMFNTAGKNPPELDRLGTVFQKLVVSLAKEQIEFDIGSEDIQARNGSVTGGLLQVGKRSYATVVLPPLTENLNVQTLQLLESFLQGGGTILSSSAPPEREDGRQSDRGAAISRMRGWKQVDREALPTTLLRQDDGFAIRRQPGDRGILFHHGRKLADGEVLFLVNTSIDSPSEGIIAAGTGTA